MASTFGRGIDDRTPLTAWSKRSARPASSDPKRHRVPWYWLIWPEARTLVAHALRDGEWQTLLTLQATGPMTGQATDRTRARTPPFDAIELDLADLLGIDG